jgi:hypothetical protein
MKKVFVLDIKPYNQNCIVICNGTFEDAEKIFRRNKENANARENLEHIEKEREHYPKDFRPKMGDATLFTKLPNGYVMMFNKEDSYVSTTGSIVHESLHLVHYVLRRARLELTEESEEAYTYLLTDIVEEIIGNIWEEKKKKLPKKK